MIDLLRLHLGLHDQCSFSALTRFFKIYVRGFRGASELRTSLMNAKSKSEVHVLLNKYEGKEHDGAEEHGN